MNWHIACVKYPVSFGWTVLNNLVVVPLQTSYKAVDISIKCYIYIRYMSVDISIENY